MDDDEEREAQKEEILAASSTASKVKLKQQDEDEITEEKPKALLKVKNNPEGEEKTNAKGSKACEGRTEDKNIKDRTDLKTTISPHEEFKEEETLISPNKHFKEEDKMDPPDDAQILPHKENFESC